MPPISYDISRAARLVRYNPKLLAGKVASQWRLRRTSSIPASWSIGNVRFSPAGLTEEPIARAMLRSMVAGDYEYPIFHILRQFLRPGDVFFDIGANVGYFSAVAMALVGPAGQVHAFEPVPRYFDVLKRIQAENTEYCLEVNRVALGDKRESSAMSVSSSENIGMNSLVYGLQDVGNGTGRRFVEVNVERLDAYIEGREIQKIDLIKIDTEGYDYHVLQGMGSYAEKFHPKVVLELNTPWLSEIGIRSSDFQQWARSRGYRIVDTLYYRPVDIERVFDERKSSNVLLLPDH